MFHYLFSTNKCFMSNLLKDINYDSPLPCSIGSLYFSTLFNIKRAKWPFFVISMLLFRAFHVYFTQKSILMIRINIKGKIRPS